MNIIKRRIIRLIDKWFYTINNKDANLMITLYSEILQVCISTSDLCLKYIYIYIYYIVYIG